MRTFNPKDHPVPVVQQVLQSGVAPRPIALVSTLDAEGRHNLSPFSFFNAFGSNPPVIVVSPAYRGTNGTPKHTFLNILATKEFTVSAVSFAMVQQINLASGEYESGVDEFEKAGLSKYASAIVAPPGVAESPFIMECRLLHHVDTGGKPGAGNLLVGEVLLFHVRESVYTGDRLDPHKLDLVARMGANWYCRASGAALFELPKPQHPGMGIDRLPEHIRGSAEYSGNDLAKLAGAMAPPDTAEMTARWRAEYAALDPLHAPDLFEAELRTSHPESARLAALADGKRGASDTRQLAVRLERCARVFLANDRIAEAWECALMADTAAIAAFTGAESAPPRL